MTKLHEWEDLHTDELTERRQAMPGGWMYWYYTSGREHFVYVPDPTAPHCRPAPTDAPPMTDEALREWLTATYGEATFSEHSRMWVYWKTPTGTVFYCESGGESYPACKWGYGWMDGDQWLPASIAGPALWAAHKYGAR